jgi:hypothetical protein
MMLQACKRVGKPELTRTVIVPNATHLGILSSSELMSALSEALDLDVHTAETMQKVAESVTRHICATKQVAGNARLMLRVLGMDSWHAKHSFSVQDHCRTTVDG